MERSVIKYKIIPEMELIIEYGKGNIQLEEYIAFKLAYLQDKQFNPQYNIIVDLRDALLGIVEDNVTNLVEFFKQNPGIVGSRKAAHITTGPNQVVNSMMFDRKIRDLNIKVKTVSTIAHAALYLELREEDIPVIERAIEEMKNQ